MVTVRADRRGLQLPQSGSVYMDLENFVGCAVEFRRTPKPAGRSQNLYFKCIKQMDLCQMPSLGRALRPSRSEIA
jgi:hypothetical protein